MSEKACEYCGRVFEVYPYQVGKRRFCSQECHYASRRKRIERTCQNCGKKFEVRPSELVYNRGLFCSIGCSRDFAHGPNAHNWQGGPIRRKCEMCGRIFYVKQHKIKEGKGRFCSRNCYNIYQRDGKEFPKIRCAICGKKITKHRENQKYCSVKCMAQGMTQIRGKDHPLYNRISKVCPACGKTFEVQLASESHYTYCSKECREKDHPNILLTCENCSKEFLAHNYRAKEARYCSHSCYWEAKSEQVEIVCEMCNKPFMVGPYRAKEARFCSRECYIKYVGPTSIEQALADELDTRHVDYEFQYTFGSWVLDFAIPDYRLAIEADGIYWHSLPDRKECDARKDAALQSEGWTILRFTGDEIRESPAACVDEIVKVLETKKGPLTVKSESPCSRS